MAFGLKYTHNFCQVKGYSTSGEYKIEIYLEGYGGASSELTCSRGSIRMNRGGELLENVQATTLSIGIENRTEGQYKEFREASWGVYKVVLIADPNGTPQTKFVGYNQSEIYTESYDQPPYTTTIEFTDGLSHLKHLRWQDDSAAIEETGKDANSTGTVSASIKLDGAANGARAEVTAVSGAHTNHIIVIQESVDDIVWTDTAPNIQGAGKSIVSGDLGSNYIRLWVGTAEGAASVVDWTLTPVYVGQKTIIEVLRLALNKLPSPIKIREIVNVYEDSINNATTDSMMNQIYVASEVYKETEEKDDIATTVTSFFCNEVIEQILKPFNAHIYQWDGIWYIIRPQEYLDSTMYYREFNANVGTESTVTVDATGNFTTNTRAVTKPTGNANELILVAPSTEMSIEPPLNRVTVTYNQDNLEIFNSNIVRNGCFRLWTTPIPTLPQQTYPTYWNLFGVDYTAFNPKVRVQSIGADFFRFEPVDQATAGTFDSTKRINQITYNVLTATTDSIQFSFDFQFQWHCQKKSTGTPNPAVPTFLYNELYVKYEVELRLGTYYLSGNPTDGYQWTLLTSRATFEQVGMDGNFGTWVANGGFIQSISTTLPSLPQTASVDVELTIYRPYSNFEAWKQTITTDYDVSFTSLTQKCFSLAYLPSGEAPIEELILHSKIDEDENVEEIETIHGDGTNTISVNSYRLASGVITDSWFRRGVVEAKEILPLLLLQMRDLRGEFKKNLSGLLIGEFEAFNTIEHTTDVVTEYYINDYDWAIETNEWNVNLMELITSTVPIENNTELTIKSLVLDTDNVGGGEPSEPPLESRIISPSNTISPEQLSLNGYI